MKKIVFMGIAILLVIGLVAGGTFAYFSDVEETSGNVIQAGTIDLEVNEENPWVTAAIDLLDIKPCEDLEPIVIRIKNVGQNNGYLYQKISYIEGDKPEEHLPDLTADEFAALIYVKSIMYQHFSEGYTGTPREDLPDMLAAMNNNSDNYLSLYELMLFGWLPYDHEGETDPDPEHTLQVGHTATWTITFHMADSLDGHVWGDLTDPGEAILTGVEDNAPQADGINITWTAILRQNPDSLNPLPLP